jgi:hypothetical protein
MKIYSIVRELDVHMRETVYLVGDDEQDALAYAREGNIWDYANDQEEVDWDNLTYDYSTLTDTGEETN